MRLTMKAGKSSATAIVLPSFVAKTFEVSKVLSSVAMPRTSSTSSITGTGFMKCMPMKRSGRSVTAASRVIEIEDVLVATIASGFRPGQSWVRILRLTCSSSVADSMTRSASLMSSRLAAGRMRSSAAWRSSSVIFPEPTWRAMLPLMVASPERMRSIEMSLSATSKPASAQTWAMPLPICPAPITPTFYMLSVRERSRPVGRGCVGPDRDSVAELGKFLFELRHGLEQIGDQAVVGHLEDRRLLVLVDGHDDLRVLHAGQVLDGARNAERHIELRRHHLAGLADLPVVRRVARVHGRAAGADRRADPVGQALHDLEVLGRADGPPARDHALRGRELRTVGLRQLFVHELRQARIRGRRDGLDGGPRAALPGGREGC